MSRKIIKKAAPSEARTHNFGFAHKSRDITDCANRA